MTEAELKELVAAAQLRYDALTPEQKLEHDWEQRRSFARGSCPSGYDYAAWCRTVDRVLPPLREKTVDQKTIDENIDAAVQAVKDDKPEVAAAAVAALAKGLLRDVGRIADALEVIAGCQRTIASPPAKPQVKS